MNAMKAPMIDAMGSQIPAVGYGTMLFPDPERAVELIGHAIDSGYRHIDTAWKYGSEEWVGEAIRAFGYPSAGSVGDDEGHRGARSG